tara:strand:+ start:163 stop:462 length:300 start_codon:yes stop_codon:yes gene_type:complete
MSLNKKYKKYKKIVYYGLSDDDCIEDIANFCMENNKIFVVMIPEQNEYPLILRKAQDLLLDDIWIYEIAMGMRVVLRSRARKYCILNRDAVIMEEYEKK